ncbi:MAG: hypothetical protein FWC22_00480 [Treponema sp.]|nr:hypothetical protein [Treponema sp.]
MTREYIKAQITAGEKVYIGADYVNIADEAIYHDEAGKRILFLTLKEKATQ